MLQTISRPAPCDKMKKIYNFLFLFTLILNLSAALLDSPNPSMVAVGRGSRSFIYRLHHANLQKICVQKDKVIIAIATALAEDDDYDIPLHTGKKPYRIRTRASVSDLFDDLGGRARRAYRMSFNAFCILFRKLRNNLEERFMPKGGPSYSKLKIRNSLRLSCAIRYYAGASI